MTEAGRLFGVFFEPGKVFADVAERPRWWVPVLITTIFAVAFTWALGEHIGWEKTVRQAIEANSRTADLPVEQREAAIQRATKFASTFGYIWAVIGPGIMTAIVALVLMGIFNGLMGTELKFVHAFAITAYAMLVRAFAAIFMTLILYLKPPEDFNVRVSPFSPAGYIDPQSLPKWLFSLLNSIDLFSIWMVILLAIGFAAASKKLKFSSALMGVAIPWVLVVLAMMSMQAIS